MKDKRKLMLMLTVPLVLLLVAGVAYKLVLAPKKPVHEKKISGALVPLAKEFLVNLAGGGYAKVSVALEVGGAAPAKGGLALEQEAAVRAVITDELTGLDSSRLIERAARKKLVKRLIKSLQARTDEHVIDVLLTDITVQ
jgi:flagellar basal body-associated protein FliL